MKQKIALLISGGVDSSVSLALLKQAGHDVHAFYLKIWLEDELSYLGSCPWQQDLEYVQAVCKQFDVPLIIVSMQQKYHEKVVSYLLAEVSAGRTPNPDVLCNQQIKFGAFFESIDDSFDFVATGHYAQIQHQPNLSILKQAKDPVKDQTYFLGYLSQAQLKRVLFPIGGFEKSQVRDLAQQFALPNAARRDSQGICFLGKIDFADFLKAHIPNKIGEIVEFETGKMLGAHEGFWFYTIGQRYGLKLSGGPWYVVSKNVQTNQVFVSRVYDQVQEHKQGMILENFNWNQGVVTDKKDLHVRFRHGAVLHDCTVEVFDDRVVVMLKVESKQGIAQGQFAVLYDGDVCLGGGFIEKAI